jgi:hypothetical protein
MYASRATHVRWGATYGRKSSVVCPHQEGGLGHISGHATNGPPWDQEHTAYVYYEFEVVWPAFGIRMDMLSCGAKWLKAAPL